MKIKDICRELDLEIHSEGDPEREIEGAIVGDLLSHILGEARENWLWITIQIHLNVSAVAVLKELPLVVLSSGRTPNEDLAAKCREENITLTTSRLSSYELCCRLCRLGI